MIPALIAISIFLIAQLVGAMYWAGMMSAKMDFMIEATRSAKATVDNHITHDLATFSTKTEVNIALIAHEKEVAASLLFANKELSAMWKQIDKLSGK